ncbi:MAG: hydroxymethylbilane synthase [Candidatus Brocadiales bacterium]
MSKKRIVIGSRGSKLAMTQSQWVKTRLEELNPSLEITIQRIITKGDKITDVALSRIGGKGLFTKELEVALQDGRIDLAVHSLKDLPTELPEGLIIGAVPEREDPHDLLISKNNSSTLSHLPKGSKLGTSSLRRQAQILSLRPDLELVDLRGNLDTRFRKLETTDLDGIIVAKAGVMRLGAFREDFSIIPFDEVLPAVGQGALGIESRKDDEEILAILASIDHPSTRHAVEAERTLMFVLEGGCQVPIGAIGHCTSNGTLELEAIVCSLNGSKVIKNRHSGPPETAREIGQTLAHRLLDMGAREVLKEIREALGEEEIGHNGN